VNLIRLVITFSLGLCLCGCEQMMLNPNHSQAVARKGATDQTGERIQLGEHITMIDHQTRDEDSFASRVAIKTKEAGEATSKAMNPASWKADPNSPAERQRRAAIRRKQKLKESEPNAFVRWMFPEPKPPRTVGEWLSQDRLDGNEH
jgi:hypothetical protein